MAIKKAMILGAGFGKRMLPLTTKIPKPLIKIGPKNLLERSIELLIKIGINEIIINTHHLSEEIDTILIELYLSQVIQKKGNLTITFSNI